MRRRADLRRSFGPALLLVSALGFACDPFGAGANPEVPLWVHHPSYSMSVVYQRDLVAESRREGEPYERGRPTIDEQGRRVFVGSSDHGLYALRAEDGDVLWRFETAGAVQCEPLYEPLEDVVYFGSNDGALYKVRADDGRLLWRFASNAEVARRPQRVGNTLYFVNANDTVLAVDVKTGQRKWSQHRPPALGMEIAGHSGVLVRGGTAYVAFSAGGVVAYDVETGFERWEPVDLSVEAEQVLGRIPKYLDVDTTPVAMNVGTTLAIVVGSYQAGVYALDSVTGGQVWANNAVLGATDVTLFTQPPHQDASGRRYPARELLLVSTGTTGLWALDPQTGADVWRRDLPEGGTQRPVVASGALLVATTQQGLFLVSPLDGGVIDGLDTSTGFSMPPAAVGERAFILSNDGDLLALHIPSPRRRPHTNRHWP